MPVIGIDDESPDVAMGTRAADVNSITDCQHASVALRAEIIKDSPLIFGDVACPLHRLRFLRRYRISMAVAITQRFS